jgi:hypothetical protein
MREGAVTGEFGAGVGAEEVMRYAIPR